jgi:serine phosphatase RsbU (regulator of sigma subunit)
MDHQTLLIGAASRPHPGETANGDGWAVHWHDGASRIALIDGLGHGPAAADAAWAATAALAAHPELPLDRALHACHGALAGTRGAALSLARVDVRAAELTFVGVGNVEAALWQAGQVQRLMVQRGIVGGSLPRVRVTTVALASDWLLLLHTDGVSARYEVDWPAAFGSRDPQGLASAVLARWARPTDDATVVVVRPA